jgi:hypothetical protein
MTWPETTPARDTQLDPLQLRLRFPLRLRLFHPLRLLLRPTQ